MIYTSETSHWETGLSRHALDINLQIQNKKPEYDHSRHRDNTKFYQYPKNSAIKHCIQQDIK